MSIPLTLRARLRPELPRILTGALCLALTNALGMSIPKLLQGAVDKLGTGGADVQGQVTRAALLIMGLAAVQAAIRTASRVLIFNAGRNVEFNLRRDLFCRLTLQPPAFYQANTIGDVMSRLTNDLAAVRMLFGPGILNILNTLFVYGMGIWLMASLSLRLTVVALIPLPLIILFGRLSTRKLFGASRAVQDQLGVLSTAIQEDLAGIATIRSYGLQDARREKFEKLNDVFFTRCYRLVRARGMLTPIFALIGGAGTLIVLWMGGREVIAGHMSVGALVRFNAYVVQLSWPTLALGWVMALWQRGIAGWSRVRDLLVQEATADQESPVDAAAPPIDAARVDICGLTVLRGAKPVLQNVSLQIVPGQMVALVGRTGSGKSTLLDALSGFLEVPAQTVFVGGHDVRGVPLRTLRASIGYAPQEAFLFSATVAENIAFAKRAPGDSAGDPADHPAWQSAVRDAATIAGLTRDLAVFPAGLQTLVGERGITLSGGQRQRVALARALYAEPRLLVLDDSLSAVDADTEQDILARLAPVLRAKNRSTLIVSHRVAAVKSADQILVMDQGRIVEKGRHEELLTKAGVYAEIYREQGQTPASATTSTAASGVAVVGTSP